MFLWQFSFVGSACKNVKMNIFPLSSLKFQHLALRIGLTGGIGSGKSTVSDIFRVLGIPVFDADTEAKKIMNTNAGLRNAIIEKFGAQIYPNDVLDRKALATIVFNDNFQLELLNSLVHPYAIAEAEVWSNQQASPYTVKEAALFFEAGSAIGIDYMIGVYAPKHLRINRVMKRDQITRDEVLQRMQRQIQEEVKMRLCDFVIMNDDQQLLIPQVLKLHERFLEEAIES